MPRISSAKQTLPESDSSLPGVEKSAQLAKSSAAGGPEHGRSLAAFGLTAIVLALIVFYAWLAMPQKPPPVVEGATIVPYDNLLGVAASAGGDVWVVGDFGLILNSSGAGQSWRRQPSGTSRTLTSVSFADPRHGFAAGSGGIIVATGDGGSTWKMQVSGVKTELLAVRAMSTAEALAVGAYGTTVVTHDGGLKWSKVELPWETLIPGLRKTYPGLEPNLNNLFFLDRNTGWIVGEYGIVLKTTDGARTWTTQRVGEALPQLYSLLFTDPAIGWAVGQAGSLIHTTDGGATFHEVKATEEDLYSIAMTGPHGIIVGNHTVLLTHDGGSSWLAGKPLPVSTVLSDVALDPGGAIAVGPGGTLLKFNIN